VRPAAPVVGGYVTDPIDLPAPGGVDATQRLVASITRDWWTLLQSPDLDDAIAKAIAASPTLETARATLAQADEVVNATRGAYYPQIDGSASGSRQAARSYGRMSSNLVTKIFSFGPCSPTPPTCSDAIVGSSSSKARSPRTSFTSWRAPM
jgi:outer membrane protein TolC